MCGHQVKNAIIGNKVKKGTYWAAGAVPMLVRIIGASKSNLCMPSPHGANFWPPLSRHILHLPVGTSRIAAHAHKQHGRSTLKGMHASARRRGEND